MSGTNNSEDPLVIAQRAERDLNSYQAKTGEATSQSDSANESGVNQSVESKFPGSTVTYGSAASGAGDNREIPDEEGGGINPATGRQTKAKDFEGIGGPEEKADVAEQVRGGDDDVRTNIRPAGQAEHKLN